MTNTIASSIQPSLLSDPFSLREQILDEINASSIPAVDAPQDAVYDLLKTSESIPESHILRLINGLEIEEFIPAKIAILLKLSWNDREASNAILSNIIGSLRDSEKISEDFSDNMMSRLSTGKMVDVLHLIYACMRFEEGKDVYRLDDLTNLSPSKLFEFIQTKELVSSRVYLERKINELSNRDIPVPQRDILSQMLRSMRIDDPVTFKGLYLKYLSLQIETLEESVEMYVLDELRESVEAIDPFHLFSSLYRILKTHDFYGKQLTKVVDLTEQMQNIEGHDRDQLFARCNSAYQNTLHLLADYKNMAKGSMTLYSLQHGLIRTEWKKIGAVFDRVKHQFCDCHSVERRQGFWPLNQTPFVTTKSSDKHQSSEETTAVFGCGWGNGHKSATANIAEILEARGTHPINIDIPGDMLSSADPAKQKGGSFSTETVVNKLAQCKAFAIINLLRSIAGLNSVQPPPSKELVRQALQRMLLVNPSSAITTIASVSEPLYKAAELMGIPVAHVNTDVDRSILTRDHPLPYGHFKSMIAYPEDVMSPQVSTTETAEQIAVVGPPTKQVYDTERRAEDIDALREELARDLQIDIPKGKKLVIISSGGNGAFSPYPELLANRYKGKSRDSIPYVAVVLCGKNNASFFNHVSQVAARLPARVIVPKEHVPSETMEKLYRVASYGGGMIGKAGGLTVFELSKTGARILIDNMPAKLGSNRGFFGNIISAINWIVSKIFRYKNYLPWEKINQDFAISQGFAKNITKVEQFHREFDEMLSHDRPVQLTTNVMKFSERLPQVLSEMKEAAAEDRSLDARRKYIRHPKQAAVIV